MQNLATLPSFDMTTPSFIQSKQRPEEYHMFIGITRGVVIVTPQDTTGNGIVSFDKYEKCTDECTFTIQRDLEESKVFCRKFNDAMKFCYTNASLDAPSAQATEFCATVPDHVLHSDIPVKYTARIHAIRIAGYRLHDNQLSPLLEVANMEVGKVTRG